MSRWPSARGEWETLSLGGSRGCSPRATLSRSSYGSPASSRSASTGATSSSTCARSAWFPFLRALRNAAPVWIARTPVDEFTVRQYSRCRSRLRPFLLSPVGWEVVQLAVHQILDLIILVRVQASQPILQLLVFAMA